MCLNSNIGRHALGLRQSGFALVTAIFILVVLAGLGAAMVSISTTQHTTVAMDIQSARAQQAAIPLIGFLDSRTPEALSERLRGFRQGLKEVGYVEGDNVTIVYRWAENQSRSAAGTGR